MNWLSRMTAAATLGAILAAGAQEQHIAKARGQLQEQRTEERQDRTQEVRELPDNQERPVVNEKDPDNRAPHYRWELAIPDHLPPEARHPQHLLPGRKVRIFPVNEAEEINGPAMLSLEGVAEGIPLEAKKKTGGAFTVELPLELSPGKTLPAGNYTVSFGNNKVVLPVAVARIPVKLDPIGVPIPMWRRDILRLGCNECYWEASIWQDPNDPLHGALMGNGRNLVTTTDGWRSAIARNIDTLVVSAKNSDGYPIIPRSYFCDPKLTSLSDGKMALVGLTITSNEAINGAVWTADKNINYFSQTLLGPVIAAPNSQLVLDYPKIVVDTDASSPWFNTMYVSANMMSIPEENWSGPGLITLRNGAIRKSQGHKIGFPQPPQSGVTLNGTVHFARDDSIQMSLYKSVNGGATFETKVIAESGHNTFAQVSSTSNRGFILYRGPQLAVDKERNILYAAWADYEKRVPDPNFEYTEYGFNFDVFVSRSFDNGNTWSARVKVNDDVGKGDQGFPNIAVDKNGTVFVSFIDHRSLQDQAVYDVYLAKSENFGASFDPNYKVNDLPVPNLGGGRTPGDYLDMLGVTNDTVNVFHPCVGKTTNIWYPTDACVTRVPKRNIPNTHYYR